MIWDDNNQQGMNALDHLFDGDDNNNIKQTMIMLSKKNSIQQFLQVHNNISTQDRSKKSHALCVNAIDTWDMIFLIPYASVVVTTSNKQQSPLTR